MQQWSFSSELPSLILLIIMMKFYYDKRRVRNNSTKLFAVSLWLASGSILVNALCLYTIDHFHEVHYAFQMLVNTAYYFLAVGVTITVTAYIFKLLLAHVYEDKWEKQIRRILTWISVGYTVLMIANLRLGLVFWFDAEGVYHRGPLNGAGYVIMVAEILMVCHSYHIHKDSVDNNVRHVIFTLSPLLIVMVIFQRLAPDILFNGTMSMMILLVFFVNFQNTQTEQDGLTGVGDSRSFFKELTMRLSSKKKFQVVLVSLKNFSRVNNRYGHSKGDEILYQMCNWLEKCHKGGRAYRFSNVTFALVCPCADQRDADELIELIRDRFSRNWELGGVSVTVPTCYVGMVCDDMGMSATQVREVLSFMCEMAKNSENGLIRYDVHTRMKFQEQKDTEQLLQDAVANDRFEVWYQPVYNCEKQEFDSAEALVRLRDARGNLVRPDVFIPLAEKNGMIEEIGWTVWKQVCRFINIHPEMKLVISVNLSAQQFDDPATFNRMEKYMNMCGVPAERLKLEITERVIMQDERYMSLVMQELTAKGFRFCVDDFGVGYSNLASVMNLPFEIIKLDRSLIERLAFDPVNKMAVGVLVDMFHNMGMKIVAEGVESTSQQELITKMGVDFIQGFYYARPMPEREALAFLKEHERKQDTVLSGKDII